MQKLLFSLVSVFFLYSSCRDSKIIDPGDLQPMCKIYFDDSSYFKTLNEREYLVYRFCAKEDFTNEVFLYEDIGYMSEKRQYFFKKDTINDCLYLDLYLGVDWLPHDQLRFYKDSKSRTSKAPDQVIVLGKNFSLNSCAAKWIIKFPSDLSTSPYFDVAGISKISETPIEKNGFITISIDKSKNGPYKSGQYVRGTFFNPDGTIDIESLMLP